MDSQIPQSPNHSRFSREKEKRRVKILVGICTACCYANRRAAVRETWLSRPAGDVHAVFFHGRGNTPTENSVDTVELDVRDGYEYLPDKVLAFFRYALENYEFEWLFKCDDDTYLVLERLATLIEPGVDLVGDPMLETRRAPSGGAGYLLSKRMIERIVETPNISHTGPEDYIFGKLVTEKFQVPWRATRNLCHDTTRMPRRNNGNVTVHWCSPQKLKSIHTMLTEEAKVIFKGEHVNWEDNLFFYKSGIFSRAGSGCAGRWVLDSRGSLTLYWHDWAPETLWRRGEEFVAEQMMLKPVEGNFSDFASKIATHDSRATSIPEHPGAPNSKTTLLFRFHAHFHVCRERLRILRYFNPDLHIYALYGGCPGEETVARQATGEFTLGFWSCAGIADAKTKWQHGDLLVREWYSHFGHALNFSHLHIHEWDILTAAPLSHIYPTLFSPAVYVSPVEPFTADAERQWIWTKDGKWRESELSKWLREKRGIERPSCITHSPGIVLSREFLEAQKKLPNLRGIHAGFDIPALAEALGLPLNDARLFTHSRNSQQRLWNITGIHLDALKTELQTECGMRIFHPVKAMVTLADLGEWGLREM